MQKVDTIGRVLIPKNLREKYNLEKGKGYNLIEKSEGILLTSKENNFTISEEDMKSLRKLYLMLKNSGILDTHYDEIFSRVTKRTNIKCPKCEELLFLTTDSTYKCFKCE